MVRTLLVVSLTLVASSLFAAAEQPQPLSVSLQPDGIAVAGATPKASIYAFSQSRELSHGFVSVVPRQTTLRDDDGDGRAAWTIGATVPLRSVWIAVDLTTGAYGVAVPAGYPATRVALSDDHLKKNFGSDITQLAFDGTLVDYVVIRPGVGAWRGTVGLRGPDDEGTDEKKSTFSVEKLRPEEGTTAAAPKHLKKDDVVFVLNSFRAEYGVVRIGEKQ